MPLRRPVVPPAQVVKWTMYLIFQEFRAGHITERTHDMLATAFLRLFNGFSTLYEYAAMPVRFRSMLKHFSLCHRFLESYPTSSARGTSMRLCPVRLQMQQACYSWGNGFPPRFESYSRDHVFILRGFMCGNDPHFHVSLSKSPQILRKHSAKCVLVSSSAECFLVVPTHLHPKLETNQLGKAS